jgi:hypothetical protein
MHRDRSADKPCCQLEQPLCLRHAAPRRRQLQRFARYPWLVAQAPTLEWVDQLRVLPRLLARVRRALGPPAWPWLFRPTAALAPPVQAAQRSPDLLLLQSHCRNQSGGLASLPTPLRLNDRSGRQLGLLQIVLQLLVRLD